MKLPISVSTDFFSGLEPEEMVLELKKAGLSHGELGISHGKKLLKRGGDGETLGRQLAQFGKDRDLHFPQGHLDMDLDLCTREGLDGLKTWLDLFHGAGVKAAVLHANGADEESLERQLELRSNAIRELVKHIEGTDMVICLENLVSKPLIRTVDGILKLIEAAGGSEQLGVCLDIGHLHRARSLGLTEMDSPEFIGKAGKRLKALHVHDNLGVNDDHLLPFVPNGLNWKRFVASLEANDYRGLFNFEIHGEAKGTPLEVLRAKLVCARQIGHYLLSDEFIHC